MPKTKHEKRIDALTRLEQRLVKIEHEIVDELGPVFDHNGHDLMAFFRDVAERDAKRIKAEIVHLQDVIDQAPWSR